jgi:hypothetical protein
MSKSLYPIVLLTYNRPYHTKRVLDALKNNLLAEQSKLFVFVDGVKDNATNNDIEKHNKLLEVINSEQWCADVNVHISKINRGCRWGPIFGISQVLEKYDAAIILEDDIITSPFFLKYMNQALNYYKDYPAVFSISAFNLPEKVLPIPRDYEYDVYVSLRQQNWGWGTWSNRWKLVDWSKDNLADFLIKLNQVEAFNRGGNDLSRMLKEELDGKSQAWDIQFSFTQFIHHSVSIIPCYSYTQNIGLDDSGTHTIGKDNNEMLNSDISRAKENPVFLPVLYEDKRLLNAFYSAYYPRKRPIWKKIINRISRLFGGKNVFVVKKKIFC